MGVAETVRLPEGAYAPDVTEKVYDRIAELTTTILTAGYSVVADAVYGRESERQAIADKARRVGAGFAGLWLEAPIEVLEQRINARQGDASDATVAVMHAQLRSVTPPQDWVRVSAETSASETLANARARLGCLGDAAHGSQ
jgi:predicted kinase